MDFLSAYKYIYMYIRDVYLFLMRLLHTLYIYFSKPLRLLWILVCFILCGSSFFLLCSLLSLIVVHYVRDCSCTCMRIVWGERGEGGLGRETVAYEQQSDSKVIED